MKKVIVAITAEGTPTVESEGFKGQSCTLATRDIELALAGNNPGNRDDKKKPEFYQTNPTTQSIHNR